MSTFNVLLLGAGPINFGTTEGPWNHTKRLERLLGERLRVVGLVDLDSERAENVLRIKRNSDASVAQGYTCTGIFQTVEDAKASLNEVDSPHLVVDGFPPIARGSTQDGHNNELRLIELFPTSAFLIEKPISTSSIDEVEKVKVALQGRIVSVGYMLRYLKAAQQIKQHIRENGLTVMLTLARYFLPYAYAGDIEKNRTLAYWDKTREQGPVVSQGTHLVDLIRYFNSESLAETLHVHTVEHTDRAGKLSQLKFNENDVLAPQNRIPRVTNAIWRTDVGGTVHFVHGIVLHEGDYDCDLTVIADGWKFTIQDPYSAAPALLVRRPGSGEEVRTVFTDDDCYYSEFEALVGVIDGSLHKDCILSDYADAVETYKLTWDITSAGEDSYRERHK